MKKDSSCGHMLGGSYLMRWFLGLLLLGIGAKMLLSYNEMVTYMMGVAGNMKFPENVIPLIKVVSQVVAYSWPVAATLIGVSLLTRFLKPWAVLLLYLYLLVFALSHVWTNDMVAAVWDLSVAGFAGVMLLSSKVGHVMEK